MKKIILCLLFMSCGQAYMSSYDLDLFFKGQTTLFQDDESCPYKMTRSKDKIKMGRYYYSDFHMETYHIDGILCNKIEVAYVNLLSCENNTFHAYTKTHTCNFLLK